MKSFMLVSILAALLAACGGGTPAVQSPADVATGSEVAPVVVELSTFWERLDREVCPRVRAPGAVLPAELTASERSELVAYCGGATAAPLALAGRSDRDDVVHRIVHPGAVAVERAPVGTLGLASLGSLDVTTLVDAAIRGLAQFLMKRAELELRGFAIDKLRAAGECARDTFRSRLVADTCRFLGGETGTIPAGFGPGLRAAFVRDLGELPRRIVREAPAEGNARQLLVRAALESAAVLIEDPDPIQIVARLEALGAETGFTCLADPADPEVQKTCLEAKALLLLAAALAREILVDGVDIRLTPEQLFTRLRDRLREVVARMPAETELAVELARLLAWVDGQTDAAGAWRRLVSTLLGDAGEAIASLREARRALKVPADADADAVARAVVTSTRHALRALDRSMAIAECLKAVAKTREPRACAMRRTYLPGRVADFLDALRRADIAAVMAAALDLAEAAIPGFERYVSPDLARLLSFGAELAGAKTKEEAEAAITNLAMPPGGWKEKRRRSMFSVGALVGFTGGVESVVGVDDSLAGTGAMLGAVGIDYSHPTGKGWTIGFFVTVIDLGGLLNVRLGEDDLGDDMTVDEAAPIGFAQVLAPGLGVRLGLGNSPIVLYAGAQLVPGGREVTDDRGTDDPSDDTSDDRPAVRFMGGLAIDVTIWAF